MFKRHNPLWFVASLDAPVALMASRLCSQIFVARLSPYLSNQDLKDMFSPFGTVVKAWLARDPKTRKSRGYGFVNFESEIDAQKAIEALDGRIVNGRLIRVEVAQTTTNGEEREGANS